MALVRCIGSTAWRLGDEVLELKFSPDGKTLWLDTVLDQVALDVATGHRVEMKKRATKLKSSADQQWQFDVRKVWKTGGRFVFELPAWARAMSDGGRAALIDGKVVTLVDAPFKQPPVALPPMKAEVKTVELSADGAFVLSGDARGNVALVDVAERRTMRSWPKARVIGFAPGRAFVRDGDAVHVVALPAGTVERTLDCPGEAHRLSPDGTRLGCARDDQVHVVSVETGEPVLTLDVNTEQFAFSPDGTRMAVVDLYPDTPGLNHWSGVVFLVDAATGETLAPRDEGHRGAVMGLAAPARQPGLLVSVGDQSLRVWDRASGHLVERVDGLVGPDDVGVSADGRWAAVASRDDQGSALVDLSSLEATPFGCDATETVVMDPSGAAVALLSEDEMEVFAIPSRKRLSKGNRPETVFAHDGLWAINDASLWKWSGKGFTHELPELEVARADFAGFHGGALITKPFSWTPDARVYATDVKTGRRKTRIKLHDFMWTALGPNHLVSVHREGALTVFRLADGTQVGEAQWASDDRPVSIAITDDGELFVGTVLGRVLHFRLKHG